MEPQSIWNDPGFWFGAVATVIAILTATREYWREQREARQIVRRDEIAFLERKVDELEQANALCEARCDELREDILSVLSQLSVQPKRRRKRVAAAE